MEQVLVPMVAIGTPFLAIVSIIKLITNYQIKKKMIEAGYVNEENTALLKNQEAESRLSALKWGILILMAGIALLLLEFIPYNGNSPFVYGFIAVFVAIGFLIYYQFAKKKL